jgi:carotenoid cleavage dioxygenase-like enzyme
MTVANTVSNARWSPYHLGFCTLDSETNVDDLPVRGTVPPWLTGTLLRTGPAKFEVLALHSTIPIGHNGNKHSETTS